MKNFRGTKTFTWEDFQKLSRLDRLKKLDAVKSEDGTKEGNEDGPKPDQG